MIHKTGSGPEAEGGFGSTVIPRPGRGGELGVAPWRRGSEPGSWPATPRKATSPVIPPSINRMKRKARVVLSKLAPGRKDDETQGDTKRGTHKGIQNLDSKTHVKLAWGLAVSIFAACRQERWPPGSPGTLCVVHGKARRLKKPPEAECAPDPAAQARKAHPSSCRLDPDRWPLAAGYPLTLPALLFHNRCLRAPVPDAVGMPHVMFKY